MNRAGVPADEKRAPQTNPHKCLAPDYLRPAPLSPLSGATATPAIKQTGTQLSKLQATPCAARAGKGKHNPPLPSAFRDSYWHLYYTSQLHTAQTTTRLPHTHTLHSWSLRFSSIPGSRRWSTYSARRFTTQHGANTPRQTDTPPSRVSASCLFLTPLVIPYTACLNYHACCLSTVVFAALVRTHHTITTPSTHAHATYASRFCNFSRRCQSPSSKD